MPPEAKTDEVRGLKKCKREGQKRGKAQWKGDR